MFPNPGKLPSPSHSFSTVPTANIPRSVFNRSHSFKTTMGETFQSDVSMLYPIYVDEVLPGDTFNLRLTTFARLATPLVPVMDNLYCDIHFFFVPCRLVWDNFKKFMGEQDNPSDSTSYVIPTVNHATGWGSGSLADYMGIPVGKPITHNSLPMRAYNLIWNQFYRDQNLQNSATVTTADSGDNVAHFLLRPRGKRHDYFTSSLPWAQKGTAVSIPLGTSAPVLGIGVDNANWTFGSSPTVKVSGGTTETWTGKGGLIGDASSSDYAWIQEDPARAGYPYIRADLSNATAATINSLRQAFQIQKMYERDARGGTRYSELILSHFGVTMPDSRWRPEFLGGGSSPVNVTPVPQTSATSGSSPLGQLAGFGTTSHNGIGFTKSFTEHGYVIGLCSYRQDQTYQYGLHKMWSRSTKLDFYWPALSHLGEQAVLNKEIYYNNDAADSDVWGYQERFAEYRYRNSYTAGLMRSGVANTLDIWHYGQSYGGRPSLGDTFIKETPPISRSTTVNTQPAFLFDAYFDLKCARPMPTYSVPGLIDHF